MENGTQAKSQPTMFAISIYYRYPDSINPEIKLLSKSKTTGIWTWLSKKGKIEVGEPLASQKDDVVSFVLSGRRMHLFENLVKNEGAAGIKIGPKKQAYYVIQYMNEADEKEFLKGKFEEQLRNTINRMAVGFMREHYMVRVADEANNNCNANLNGDLCLFELVDDSEAIRKETQADERIYAARGVLKELYDNDLNEFTNFCYAYGISDAEIKSSIKDVLFNNVWKRIQDDVEEFMRIFNHQERKLIAIVNRGKETVIDKFTGSTAIRKEGGYYYMDDVLLGEYDNDVISFFQTHPRLKENLYRKLGIEADIKVELKEMPKVGTEDIPTLSPAQEVSRNNNDKSRIASYKAYVYKAIKDVRDKKNTFGDLDKNLAAIRAKAGFSDYKDILEPFIEQQKATLK